MAAPATLPALLHSLTKSLTSTLDVAPKLSAFELPKDGISLLDVKNELLLSYLQNLVFLILLKLRGAKDGVSDDADEQSLSDLVVTKLVELRLYLEKGARPLEDKLRFQIDKVLRAADDAERVTKAAEEAAKADESDPESEAGSDDEDAQIDGISGRKITDLQHRPNFSGFQRPAAAAASDRERNTSGVYRPPRIAPTAMPTTDRREKAEKKQMKSATLEEYIADEMSTAPMAEPSIGTTILQGGRKIKTSNERRKEDERRDYEERNFVRLPKESKKDKAQRAKSEGRSSRMNFGGEDWRDLNQGVDRISRLTKGKASGGGTKALLEKSRKRGIDTLDGPRGGGGGNMGEHYEKRLKVLDGGRGTRGKGR